MAKFGYWFDGVGDALNGIRAKSTGYISIPVSDEKDVVAEFMLWCKDHPTESMREVAFSYLSGGDEFLLNKVNDDN